MRGAALSKDRELGSLERMDLATFTLRFPRGVRAAPVVITDVARAWPARERWTHAFLLERLGKDDVGHGLTLTPELERDVSFPEVARRREQTNVWFMPDGYVSELHFDLPHNLNTVLRGTKDVVLFAPSETRYLYPHSALSPLGPQNSRVRLDDVEDVASRFARVRLARHWRATIAPGETLYIPPCFWHHVRSRGESVAVNVWFRDDEPRLLRTMRLPRSVLVARAARAVKHVLDRRR